MTCQRLIFAAVLAALAGVTACGGSSSETPPPLEPDPRGFHYAPASLVAATSDSDAGEASVTGNGPASSDNDDIPRPRPSSTWGEPSALPR